MLSENVKCSKVIITEKHWVWKKSTGFFATEVSRLSMSMCIIALQGEYSCCFFNLFLFREYFKSTTVPSRHYYALDKCVFPLDFQSILPGCWLVSYSLVWRPCSNLVETWCLQSNKKEILCKNTKKDSVIIKIENLRINRIFYSIINTFWKTSFG